MLIQIQQKKEYRSRGADVAYAILGELINQKKRLEDYGLTKEDLTEELKKDYERVVAG